MRSSSIFNAILLWGLCVSRSEYAHSREPIDLPSGVEFTQGALDYVVCIAGQNLNVRDQTLSKILFTVSGLEPAKPVQSFDVDTTKKTINGVEVRFIKAEFPQVNSTAKVGWIADKYLRTRAECVGASLTPNSAEDSQQSSWSFPTIKRPSTSYREGMRRFKASRSGGRLHAACDLYRVTGEQAVAVTDGTVIRDRYYFYQGTYAIEVKHTGGAVVRYGEITGKAAPNIRANKPVKPAQAIGFIGKVNSNCCEPMLHFEFYTGTAKGSLSQSGNSFNRRKDLIDPTGLLVDWEKLKFGVSY